MAIVRLRFKVVDIGSIVDTLFACAVKGKITNAMAEQFSASQTPGRQKRLTVYQSVLVVHRHQKNREMESSDALYVGKLLLRK